MKSPKPEPGHYWLRKFKNGPRLPVRIWLDRTSPEPDEIYDRAPVLACSINGKDCERDELMRRWRYMWNMDPKDFRALTKRNPVEMTLDEQPSLF